MDSAATPPSAVNRATGATSPEFSTGISTTGPETAAEYVADALRLQEIRRLLVDSANEGMCGIDADGTVTFVNPALERMTGWSAEELLGKPHQTFVSQFAKLSETGAPRLPGVCRGNDAILLRKDGGSFPAAYACNSIFHDRRLSATVIVFQDISEKRRAEQWELTRSLIFSAILSNQALDPTLRMLADAFVARYPGKSIAILLRRDGKLYLQAETGWPARTPYTGPVSADLREVSANEVELCFESSLASATGEDWGTVAVFDRDGAMLEDAIRGTIQRVCDLACVAVAHQHLYEEVVNRSQSESPQASPSRLFLEKCLQPAMVAARQRNKIIAVGYLDLDRLKQISGSLGPDYADELIKAVSHRLNLCLRDVDVPLRYSGDGFLFALCDLNEPSEAQEIAERLLQEMLTPFLVKGHLLATTASIGISLFPQHGDTPTLLLRHADVALQAVRQADRGGVQLYSDAMGRQSRRATEIPGALLQAIQEDQFQIAYQPIYAMNKHLAGFEALLRWKHPNWGVISPLEFIPIAERTGLIVPLGDWVIHEVCRQAVAWGAASLPGIKFFANVSGVQLERPDFSSKIANTLRRSGLPPDRLELEITESWIISDLKGAARKLLLLRDLGIGIAIDDFGTGYSTFNYLQELPLDTIKIDRSFIHRLDGSNVRPSTVRAITGMAQQLGMRIVAEGVETPEQEAELVEIGCDLMQGFWFSRPLNPPDAWALLKKQLALGNFSPVDAAVQLTESRP